MSGLSTLLSKVPLASSNLATQLASNKSLYKAVSLLANPVDQRVAPRKWLAKGFNDSYYIIKSAYVTEDGKRGVIKGQKVFRGRIQDQGRVRTIRGGLKHFWEPLGPATQSFAIPPPPAPPAAKQSSA
ncbi:hypothetical protein PYCC9005_001601 [Savitreella phatthalungensis]